jgi:hypothetical protein
MCTVLDEIENKGITEGIAIGVDGSVKKLAVYFAEQNSALMYEEAIKMAEDILKK